MIGFDDARKLVTELHEFAAGQLPLSPASADKRKEFLLAFIAEREAAERKHEKSLVAAKRSGFVSAVGALHNAMPGGFVELDTDKVIGRVAGHVTELSEKLKAAVEVFTTNPEEYVGKEVDCVARSAENLRKRAGAAEQELQSAWEAANRSGFPVPSTLAALIDYMVRCDTSTRATVLDLEQEVARAKAHLCSCGRNLSPGLCSVCDNDE